MFADGRAERLELHRAQTVWGVLDERQLVVRIGAGVAVTRKVFAARRHTLGLKSPNDHRAEPRDLVGAFRQRAIADDGILRVGVNVQHRSVIERDADGGELARERATESFGQGFRAGSSEHRHRRPPRERLLQSGDAAALLVDAHPRRHRAPERLGLSGEFNDLLGRLDVAPEQNHAPEIELTG